MLTIIAELLSSRKFNQWNLFDDKVKVSIYKTGHEHLMPFLKIVNDLVVWHDIDRLIKALYVEYFPNKSKFFINSPKLGLKAG